MKTTVMALAAVAALTTAVAAQDLPTVKDIDVTVDIAAINNARAADYWKTLEPDLEAAILSHLQGRVADDGSAITVDISEVELASGFTEAAGLEQSMLKGMVRQEKKTTPDATFDSYDLTVDYSMIAPTLGEGFNPAASAEDAHRAYTVLVDAFADHVVKNLK